MPRTPSPINNEFIPVTTDGKSPMVQCRHCREGKVAKASNKRKAAHLQRCEAYLRAQGAAASDSSLEPVHDVNAVSRRAIVVARPYWWPHDASLRPETTALVVIDMQRDFCSPGGYLDHSGAPITHIPAIIPALQHLLSSCRASNLPVYHTREGHRPDLSTLSSRERLRSKTFSPSGISIGEPGPLGRLLVRGEAGHDFIPELYPLPHEPVIDKPGKSAFQYTDFELLLRNKGVRNLIFAGVTTDVCVSGTVREAADKGFDCLVVEECVASMDQGLHEATLEGIRVEGGVFGCTAKLADVVDAVATFALRKGGLLDSSSPSLEQGSDAEVEMMEDGI